MPCPKAAHQERTSRRNFLQKTGTLTLGATASALLARQPSELALGATQSIPEAAQVVPIYCFDFGGDSQWVAPGFEPVSRVYRSPRYLWITPLIQQERIEVTDPLMRDFLEGPRGEFWVGLDPASYRITLIMGDHEKAHGPFTVYLQGESVKSGVQTAAGEVLRLEFPARVEKGHKLRLHLEAAPGRSFLLNGLVIEGPPGKAAHRMFKSAPSDRLPTVEEALREGSMDARGTLRRYCDWLLTKRYSNGFLGDRGSYGLGPPTKDYWYTAAYPIRTLLAGHAIFEEPRYLAAVLPILDKLVEEQLPNGAWQQTFRNKPTSRLSKAELNFIERHTWMNMADIGSIATALAVSCYYVGEPRKSRYLHAIRRYCDNWASRWQLPSGAFTNGMESGVPQTAPYSVATGTEAAAFAAVYAVSGEVRYLQTAQRAAEFLLDHWQPDGQPICFPHAPTNGGREFEQPITQFGDSFYYHDGILLVYHQTSDRKFREKVEKVYGWCVEGDKGLLRCLGDEPWFPLQDGWNNSKSAGMPLVFLTYQGINKAPGLIRAIGLAQRFLCTSQFAERIGVMVDDPDLPWGGHSLQSWAGFAVAATGFAGLTVAEMVRPGAIFLSNL